MLHPIRVTGKEKYKKIGRKGESIAGKFYILPATSERNIQHDDYVCTVHKKIKDKFVNS